MSLYDFIMTNVRESGHLTREAIKMATDTKNYNDKGLDSSKETNPQSPQNRAGTAQDFEKFSKGSVQTGFKGVKQMASDNDAYGKDHSSVDLGKMLHQPQVSDSGRDIADATSQSPLAQSRGTADPTNVGPGSVKMGMK